MPKLDWRELAAIFAGGFLGALARVLLIEVAPVTPGSWPWATFVANVAGTLLLGYFVTRLQERLPVSAYRRPLLGMGLLGGVGALGRFLLDAAVSLWLCRDSPVSKIYAIAIHDALVARMIRD